MYLERKMDQSLVTRYEASIAYLKTFTHNLSTINYKRKNIILS